VLKKIDKLAQLDKKRGTDPRYLKIMGFLVAKGFLYHYWGLTMELFAIQWNRLSVSALRPLKVPNRQMIAG
jgi:hypothetical protein